MSLLNVGPVIAVTKHGPIRYNTLNDALNSAFTDLPDPIFSAEWPIDTTYLRGPGLDDWNGASGVDPWKFLVERAKMYEEPEPSAKRGRR